MRTNFNDIRIYSVLYIIVLLFVTAQTHADTAGVFKQYENRVLQIRIIDKSSSTKSTIGSGFFIDKNGTIATNYHVVSKVVFNPEQYRIEYVTQDKKVHNADLEHIDVIHDLALLSGDAIETPFLTLSDQELNKGSRIYTLGNPLDLGMTIVEGTYNGLTKDTMHERILLAAALNPGMSGGPSIIEDGSVVGVNVATAGNSIGFLVPQKFLRALASELKSEQPKNFMKVIRQQLLDNQKNYISQLTSKPLPTKKLGNYIVPAKMGSYLNCWGDSKKENNPYQKSSSFCATKNDIYLNQNLNTGTIRYIHHYFEDIEMGKFRFAHLIQTYFQNPGSSLHGNKEDFTEYNCKVDYIRHNNVLMKTALCFKEYKKFRGLFDMVLHIATLNEKDKSLISTFALSGVDYEQAIKFSKHYIGGFKWKLP